MFFMMAIPIYILTNNIHGPLSPQISLDFVLLFTSFLVINQSNRSAVVALTCTFLDDY